VLLKRFNTTPLLGIAKGKSAYNAELASTFS
jgi:hypothetical protein